MLISLILIAILFAATLIFLIMMGFYRFCIKEQKIHKGSDYEVAELWSNLSEYEWGHEKLFESMVGALKKKSLSFECSNHEIKNIQKSFKKRASMRPEGVQPNQSYNQ